MLKLKGGSKLEPRMEIKNGSRNQFGKFRYKVNTSFSDILFNCAESIPFAPNSTNFFKEGPASPAVTTLFASARISLRKYFQKYAILESHTKTTKSFWYQNVKHSSDFKMFLQLVLLYGASSSTVRMYK